jgi:hypothetical protein
MRNTTIGFFVWTLLALLTSCASSSHTIIAATTQPVISNLDADIYEPVIRVALIGVKARNGTVFISLGAHHADPPPALLNRLTDLHLVLKPRSVARIRQGDIKVLVDPQTCEDGVSFTAEILKRESKTRVLVQFTVDRGGPFGGSGGEVYVELKNGKWTISDQELRIWMS